MTSFYTCAAYSVVLVFCVIGAFDRHYDANLAQRLAMGVLSLWIVARIDYIRDYGWMLHEPLLATGLACYAIGSVVKTLKWRHKSW